jgi:hypothetical protein
MSSPSTIMSDRWLARIICITEIAHYLPYLALPVLAPRLPLVIVAEGRGS